MYSHQSMPSSHVSAARHLILISRVSPLIELHACMCGCRSNWKNHKQCTQKESLFYLQHKAHNIIITIIIDVDLLLYISPYMVRHVVLGAVRRVGNLAPNTKLGQMRQCANRFMRGPLVAPPNGVHQTPMPHTAEQMFNPYPIVSMHINVLFLPSCEAFTPNEKHTAVHTTFKYAIIGIAFIIFEVPLGLLWPSRSQIETSAEAQA